MKALLVLLPLLLAASPAAAQEPIRYEVRFDNAVHHEARIEATFPVLPPGPLAIVMSRSSPGRYAVHDFAKNVYDVNAVDGAGRPLEVERVTPHEWRVTGHDGTVGLGYTLFGDHADGTYTGIDATHAHLNMPATFVWARGLERRPITIRFHTPAGSGWKAATQLAPAGDGVTFTAPDLQYFMDSPTELSDFVVREWQVEPAIEGDPRPPGERYTIRLVVHHDGTDADVDAYAAMAAAIVEEEAAIFGELPDFDYGEYTFLADYLPYVFGDGMEHRNSTVLTNARALAAGALGQLGTLAHEFFHAWNMERIRSAALEPFDFERANMSDELWFGEGFTSYYDDLVLHRAGFLELDAYLERLAAALDAVIGSPARRFYGPAGMSRRAPFVDAATSIDATNWTNTFISYYTYGSVLALGLDLTLRSRYDTTLDDYMRAVWQRHGRPEVPYTAADLERALAEVTGDARFARTFFRESVEGGALLDFDALLARAGLLLREANPGRVTLGDARIAYEDGAARLASATRIGSPLYEAGLDRGDRILRLDGRTIASAADLEAVLVGHAPGDALTVAYEQRGRTRTARIVLGGDDRLEIVPYEAAGRQLTEPMRRFRESWLGSKVAASRASS